MRFRRRVRLSIEQLESRVLLSRIPVIPPADLGDAASTPEPAEVRTLPSDAGRGFEIRDVTPVAGDSGLSIADRDQGDAPDNSNTEGSDDDVTPIVTIIREERESDTQPHTDDDEEEVIEIEDPELLDPSAEDDEEETTLTANADDADSTEQRETVLEVSETEAADTLQLATAIETFVELPTDGDAASTTRDEEVAAYSAQNSQEYVEFATAQAAETADASAAEVNLSQPEAAADANRFDPIGTPLSGIGVESNRANDENASNNTINIAAASLFAVTLSKPFNRLKGQSASDSNGTQSAQPLKDLLDPFGRRRRDSNPRRDRMIFDDLLHRSEEGFGDRSGGVSDGHPASPSEEAKSIDKIFLEGAILTLLETPEDRQTGNDADEPHTASIERLPTLMTAGALTTLATGLAAAHRTNQRNKKRHSRPKPTAPIYNGPTVLHN